MRKIYPTDLSDEECAYLCSRLPDLPKTIRTCAHSLRDILDAIFYVLRSGCTWRMIPGDFPPWSTVYYHFRRFRLSGVWHLIFVTLRSAEKERVGKDPDASAAKFVDSQSMKRPPRKAQHRTATTPTRTSRAESGIFWSTPWAYRFRSTSPPPTYGTGPRSSAPLARRSGTAGAPPKEDLGGRRDG